MDKNLLGTFYVMASATGFGLMAIFALFAYEAGANVVTVLFFRFTIASIFMWGYWAAKKSFPKVDRKELYYLIGLGIIGYGSMSGLFFSALNYIPASLTSMLLYTYPAIVTIVAILLKDESFSLTKGVALLLSLIGLIFILGTSIGTLNPFGVLLGLGSACFYSCYIIVSNRVLKKVSSWEASTYVITSAAIIYLFFGLVTNQLTMNVSLQSWIAITAIAVFSTIVAISCFFVGITYIGPAKASIVNTIEPIITVVAAAILFNEVFTLHQVFGGIL
ncbi:MAG: DMT family transporter, partial [Bacillota bacterium]|nr:DMT family transporter [Bacillota bacterium]